MSIAMVLRKDATDAVWSALEESASTAGFLETSSSITADPANLLELPFNTSALPELLAGQDRATSEFNNAVAIYEALGAMPRVAAADERLWTYLALGPFRPYMEGRWPLDGLRSWKKRTQDRWLIKSATYGTLIRHGIARLWWLAELTYDPTLQSPLSRELEDPWAYLRVALANEDRIVAIFDRDSGLNPTLRLALLEFCHRNEPSEAELRSLMKEVTLLAGYRDLSAVDPASLLPLLEELRAG
ncbi:DUF6339 family protein [Knoellia locipacati]|uniref:DUF6339 family protein n=1 Tax=Knoellia locipacati TaxID=882824 RepID=UPI00385015A0